MKFPPKAIDEIEEISCGCGQPDLMWEAIHKYLENYDLEDWNKRTLNLSNGEQYFLAYFLTHIGLIEHGGSVSGSWITESGKEVLEFLRLAAPDYSKEINEAVTYRNFVEKSRK